MKAKNKTFSLSDADVQILTSLQNSLGVRSCSAILSMALRALDKSFAPNNSNILEYRPSDVIPTVNLPGMSERVVRTHMYRWNLSSDEYLSVVHQTMASFAAHGSEMKNPESIIFGACRRFANKRDSEKHAQNTEAPAAETPSTPDVESTYDLQDRLG